MRPEDTVGYLERVAAAADNEQPSLGPYRAMKPFTVPAAAVSSALEVTVGLRFVFDGDESIDIKALLREGFIVLDRRPE